ncbi:glycosyltransferase [Muribaculum intestinale]|nr:glycosyltransferase [Muribaculum intestinale]
MPTLLQINVTANWGSTGKIAEDIGRIAIEAGWESWIAYGRGNPHSQSKLIRIGSDFDMNLHGLQTRLFDNHGLASNKATKHFIKQIKAINPDIIHLHNIHGYYINYEILFDYLKEWGGPVVWTLHDCWPFTGHCAYYEFSNCYRWKSRCYDCPQIKSYPASLCYDRSTKNFFDKQESFLGCKNLTIVAVSDWLRGELKKSFLKEYPLLTIHNGIDLSIFKPSAIKACNNNGKNILGVASVWDKRKGLEEFVKLRDLLPENYLITLVGLSKEQISSLPDGIIGIRRTENVQQLVDLYSMADVYVNPTLEDNFPTTNLEALACGTPVITYKTGGSIEAIDAVTGITVEYKDIHSLSEEIKHICELSLFFRDDCRKRAEKFYNKSIVFQQYLKLYKSLL